MPGYTYASPGSTGRTIPAPLARSRFRLDGTHPGALASVSSANSHRERRRELAPRNRGNPRGAVSYSRKVPSPAGRSLPFWKMWGEVGSLFYERVAREAWNLSIEGGRITIEHDTRAGGRR